ERHCVVGIVEREILPHGIQRRGACHCGEPQRSIIGIDEAVVWAVAEVRDGHPEHIAAAVRSGLGEMPQVERTIVDDAVIAADKLHEAGDGAVVEDRWIAGNSAVRQWPDEAVIGQGADTGRPKKNPAGLKTVGIAEAGKVLLPTAHHRSGLAVDRHATTAAGRADPGAELSLGEHILARIDSYQASYRSEDRIYRLDVSE